MLQWVCTINYGVLVLFYAFCVHKPKEYLILRLHYNKQSVQDKNVNWIKWKLLLRG